MERMIILFEAIILPIFIFFIILSDYCKEKLGVRTFNVIYCIMVILSMIYILFNVIIIWRR